MKDGNIALMIDATRTHWKRQREKQNHSVLHNQSQKSSTTLPKGREPDSIKSVSTLLIKVYYHSKTRLICEASYEPYFKSPISKSKPNRSGELAPQKLALNSKLNYSAAEFTPALARVRIGRNEVGQFGKRHCALNMPMWSLCREVVYEYAETATASPEWR